ncbi:MAG: hypothetical protein ACREBD_01215 [Blastocatellia bacterium]
MRTVQNHLKTTSWNLNSTTNLRRRDFGGGAGGSVVSNIYPLGSNQRFFYFELTQRF